MTAFQTSQVSVGTSATQLVAGLEGRYQIVVDMSGSTTVDVFLGDSSVTTANGFPMFTQGGGSGSAPDLSLARISIDVLLDSTDALYAVATSATTVSVMVNPR